VDLTKTLGIWSVRDVAFLHGYGEPTLLVLHERAPTWAARTSLVADTCAVSAVSLDLFRRKHVVIWQRTELPHTSYRLCAMPDPLGGALVISQNFVAHESQDSSRALALNPLAGGDLVSLDPAAMKAGEGGCRGGGAGDHLRERRGAGSEPGEPARGVGAADRARRAPSA
jgi:cleavage and polyadenylation specificity factor subunit 1